MADLRSLYPELRGDERQTLTQFLDLYRATVLSKIEDLDDAQASSQCLPATRLTVGGIVKHLAYTERHWFVERLQGSRLHPAWGPVVPTDEPDWVFHSAREYSVAELVAM